MEHRRCNEKIVHSNDQISLALKLLIRSSRKELVAHVNSLRLHFRLAITETISDLSFNIFYGFRNQSKNV